MCRIVGRQSLINQLCRYIVDLGVKLARKHLETALGIGKQYVHVWKGSRRFQIEWPSFMSTGHSWISTVHLEYCLYDEIVVSEKFPSKGMLNNSISDHNPQGTPAVAFFKDCQGVPPSLTDFQDCH